MAFAGILVWGLLSAGTAQAQQPGAPVIERGTIRQAPAQADLGFRWSIHNFDRPIVSSVDDNSPAAHVGLAVGDTIMMVDGRSTLPLTKLFPDAVPGRKYVVRVKRGAETHEFTIEAVAPAAPAATPGSDARPIPVPR